MSELLSTINNYLYTYILVALLVGVGIFLTIHLRFVQIVHFKDLFKSLVKSRQNANGGISSFQAFAVGIGTRIGIGNIAGVALALVLGGPGAIFWMWIVALVGMATAFAESTLAQIFKVPSYDRTYRGGPAYYIKLGLNSKLFAVLFALITVVSTGIAVPMVQVNTLAATLNSNHAVPLWITGVIAAVILAPVIIAGVRGVAKVSEYVGPIMALAYVIIAVVVIVTNIEATANAFVQIFEGAFGLREGLAGVGGGIFATILNGTRRGLFSNEAGLGTAPNAAGTATVAHPASQGFAQAFGVFIDTIIVCTITALLILIAGNQIYTPGKTSVEEAGSLTSQAVIHLLGSGMSIPMSVIIFVFGISSAIGAYSYGQVSLDILTNNKVISLGYRVLVVICCAVAAVQPLTLVWSLADVLLGLGGIINLVALLLLAKWVSGTLRDYNSQVKHGKEPVFIGRDNPFLPKDLPTKVWE
ncbi:alanine/glycine:cation symporter family protein [Actinomyces sp. zg-332]|uniref:alanine/glycine:cation symporter family protein n=1 Tax=Actinomyces sp. zg-332 TaxID=2708340 RepID=UPI001E43EE26|nr:alanine/glycine:cation symporter family protein [Actinomyces sp. zg-332]